MIKSRHIEQSQAPSVGDAELTGIEVLRFLCACSILIWHYQHFFFVGEYDKALASQLVQQPFYLLLKPFYKYGSWAVQMFWAISGFIFYWCYSDEIAGSAIGPLQFGIRRFSRLYPLHFVTLILVTLGQSVYFASHGSSFIDPPGNYKEFVSQLLFASNWFDGQRFTFNSVIWSVSVEILIYFAFFLVVRLFGSSVLVPLFACVGFGLLKHTDARHLFLSDSVFACGMYFFAGGVVERVWRHRLLVPLVALSSLGVLVAILTGTKLPGETNLIVLAICMIVAFAKSGEKMLSRLFNRLAFLGNATYAVYLCHFPLQLLAVLIVDALGYSRNLFFDPLVFLLYILFTVGTSFLVFHLFERPAQNWIRSAYQARFSIQRTV